MAPTHKVPQRNPILETNPKSKFYWFFMPSSRTWWMTITSNNVTLLQMAVSKSNVKVCTCTFCRFSGSHGRISHHGRFSHFQPPCATFTTYLHTLGGHILAPSFINRAWGTNLIFVTHLRGRIVAPGILSCRVRVHSLVCEPQMDAKAKYW
jgi:hypothetical protein